MGDHRASVKIQIEFHGVKDEMDGYFNYTEGSCPGVSDYVRDFFQSVYERGMANYREMIYQADKERYDRENEARDRRQLERLKKKYEKGGV